MARGQRLTVSSAPDLYLTKIAVNVYLHSREAADPELNGALTTFLNARLYLYTNVYYHRTTRAIDLHLREIFPETMKVLFPGNPLDHMEDYLYLTDWSLLEDVSRWRRQNGDREALAKEWETVLHREVKWKMAYDRTLSLNELRYGVALIQDTDWEKRIRGALPAASVDPDRCHEHLSLPVSRRRSQLVPEHRQRSARPQLDDVAAAPVRTGGPRRLRALQPENHPVRRGVAASRVRARRRPAGRCRFPVGSARRRPSRRQRHLHDQSRGLGAGAAHARFAAACLGH